MLWQEVFLSASLATVRRVFSELIPAIYSPGPVPLDTIFSFENGAAVPALPCLLAQQSSPDLPDRFQLLAEFQASIAVIDLEARSPLYLLLSNRTLSLDLKIQTYERIWASFPESDLRIISNVFTLSGDSLLTLLCRLGLTSQALSLHQKLKNWPSDPEIDYFASYLIQGFVPKLGKNMAYVEFLNRYGPINTKGIERMRYFIHPIESAVKNSHFSLVTALLSSGLSFNSVTSTGYPLLSLVISHCSPTEIRSLLPLLTPDTPLAFDTKTNTLLTYERQPGNSVLEAVINRNDVEITTIVVDFIVQNSDFDGKKYTNFLKSGDKGHLGFPLLVKKIDFSLIPIIFPSNFLSNFSFQRFFLRILDCAVGGNRENHLTALTTHPSALSLLLNPKQCIKNTKFLSKLHLYYNISEYRENVNEDFLKNSMLISAINRSVSVEIVKEMVNLGCLLINEELEEGKHVNFT